MAEQEAGWRNDPYGRFQQRYFNGKKWTERVSTDGEQQVDPLGASTVIPIATPSTAFAASVHRGPGTAFAAAGLVATLLGVSTVASDFGETWAPLFVLAVGLGVAFVGSNGARRATTWWGALLIAIATGWFVAVQWEPGLSGAVGSVLIVTGVVLVAIPLIDDPSRKALRARSSGGSTPTPPPPDSSGS